MNVDNKISVAMVVITFLTMTVIALINYTENVKLQNELEMLRSEMRQTNEISSLPTETIPTSTPYFVMREKILPTETDTPVATISTPQPTETLIPQATQTDTPIPTSTQVTQSNFVNQPINLPMLQPTPTLVQLVRQSTANEQFLSAQSEISSLTIDDTQTRAVNALASVDLLPVLGNTIKVVIVVVVAIWVFRMMTR